MRGHAVVIVCPGPSFNTDEWPIIRSTCDTIAVNSAHIPIHKTYPSLTPTFAFAADNPKRSLSDEWLHSSKVCCVINTLHSYNVIREPDTTNYELFDSVPNPEWSSNPFKQRVKKNGVNKVVSRLSGPLVGPYKSTLLAYQWALRQGYTTIAFYGCDLKDEGKYAGHNAKLSPLEEAGRGFSYRDTLFCLDAWSRYKLGCKIINLSPTSRLSEVENIRTMTVSEFAEETQFLPNVEPMDYKEVYSDLYDRGYHMNPDDCRGKEFAEFMIKNLTYDSVLDIGCSRGKVLDLHREKGIVNEEPIQIYGIDVATRAVRYCKKKNHNVTLASAIDLPFADSSIDLVCSSDMMEHLHPDDIDKAVDEQVRVAKKYIAHKICVFAESGNGSNKAGRQLHLSTYPMQRWVERFERRGFHTLYRKGDSFILERD